MSAFVLALSGAISHAQRPQGGGNGTPGAPAGGGGGQAAGGGGGGAQAAPPAAKPLMPVAASSVGMRPNAYYGTTVTVYGVVDQSLSPLAFSMDQYKDKSVAEQEILVLAPRMHEPVPVNQYVTVIGEVVRPDAAEIAKRAKAAASGLPAEILAQHAGRPVILATAVITGDLKDLAKFIPPPMTAEEEVLDKAMKAVSNANGALRKGIDASNVELVKTNTAILAKAFAETEAFWKKRGKEDAVKLAQTARTAVDGIEKAVAAGNWNDAKTHNTTLGQQCAACHGVYRERGEDGSFYIKPGSGN